MKTPGYISIVLLILPVHALGQIDTAVGLHEVNITSSRLAFNTGHYEFDFDSASIDQNRYSSLTDLLTDNSAIYLKQYSPGGLSTISLRGGSAYHTAILWNGFSLASPLHGLTDLSLIDNFFFDEIGMQFGGSASLWGSGAVSGNITVDNKQEIGEGLKIVAGLNVGSFSEFKQLLGVFWSKGKYSGLVKLINENNTNNFTYRDNSTQSTNEQVHSSIRHYGILNENHFQTGVKSVLNLNIWYTYSNREIPPTIQQVNSDAVQLDKNARYSAEWKLSGNKSHFSIRSAFFQERLNYTDDFITDPSDNKSKSFVNEAIYDFRLSKNHILQAGVNYIYSIADSSANLIDATESRISFFSLYRFRTNNEKLETSIGIRKEINQLNNPPFIFSGGINYNAFKFLLFRLAASNVYRNPTLNDLYWSPGGNKNLKPENGFSAEAGMQINISELNGSDFLKSSSLTFNSTVYYKKINDWIIWYPSGSSVWKPQNLLQVISQGIELSAKYQYKARSFSTGCEVEFFYTSSKNEKPILQNDASLHQQLIYVPQYQWNGKVFFSFKNFTLNFYHSYTGYRYTSSDNIYYLDPYFIDNLQLDKTIILNSTQINLFVRLNNIFNTDYQSVLNRPMPLSSYTGGITFTFRKLNHSKTN